MQSFAECPRTLGHATSSDLIRAGDIDANGLLMLTEARVAPPFFFANRIERTRPAFEREERGAPSQ